MHDTSSKVRSSNVHSDLVSDSVSKGSMSHSKRAVRLARRVVISGFVLGAFLIAATGLATAALAESANQVTLETTQGTILIELYPDKAPATVANFLQYVNDGFYNKTVFHRVIDGFMIQGGGFTSDLKRKITGAPVKNEADNGLSNERGTVAMARTSDPHSATAQFFINSAANGDFLDHGKTSDGWGYTVFGRVIEGMDVVDAISKIETEAKGPGMANVPVTEAKILSASANQ